MIFTDRTITIHNSKSTINEPVILYRGDFEVSIRFTIMESKFRFKSGVNLVDSEKASFGQLAILTPYCGDVFSEVVKCEDGTLTFTLTKEMIDQLEEVGLYSFQIRLFDYYRESRVSIPPVEFGIEVREPVASEDRNNEVGDAIAGYSIARNPISKITDGLNEVVPDTFDANGQYNKTDWETGDRISEGRLNKIEDALDKINQNEITNKNALNKQMTSNFNVLQSQIDNMIIESGNADAEVEQARGKYNLLNQRLDAMDKTDVELLSQLAHIENNVSILKLKNVYDAKCMGGVTNDTLAIQNFIDDLELEGVDGRGGIIQLPAGEIRIDGLVFKASKHFKSYNNRLIIKGSGIQATTLICDDDSNDNFIDFQGYYNDSANRQQCANISFQDLKVKCISSKDKVAFNYNVTQYCDLTNVWIEGFKGGALKFVDGYDSNYYNVNIIECGRANTETDYAPAIAIYGNNDCSNALHFTNCRLEFLPIFIEAKTFDGRGISGRHIYFDNCKFEKLSWNNISACRPIDLRHQNEWGFNNCMFVNSCEYLDSEYLCDNGKHFMKLNHPTSSYVDNNNQIRSTKISNCHFISPQRTYSNWGGFIGVHIDNTDFNSCYGLSDHTECFYISGETIFNNVNISSKGTKLFVINGSGNIINIPLLRIIEETSPLFKLYGGVDYNEININILGGSYTGDYVKLNNVSTDFLQNNKVGRYHLKNNKIKINNKNNVGYTIENGGCILNTKDIVYLNSDKLQYMSYGYSGQTFIIKTLVQTTIEHDGNYIYLKEKTGKTLNVNECISFKNINGVWYEI